MFGYIAVNKAEMKFKEFDLYQSFYCGFCQELKSSCGRMGQLTLSYDLTFLIILFTSLYETKTQEEKCRCIAHPFEVHPTKRNEFTVYAAEMNMLLAYFKCEDDWIDERKKSGKLFGMAIQGKTRKIMECYPQKTAVIRENLELLHQGEKQGCTDVDEMAGYFGKIMAEIFAVRQDEWEEQLRQMGFFMGKFIYLMDAYEDLKQDIEKKRYNPFIKMCQREDFESWCEQILTMMIAEVSKNFERLPLLEYTEILRNILYSGVWCRYEMVKNKHKEEIGEE